MIKRNIRLSKSLISESEKAVLKVLDKEFLEWVQKLKNLKMFLRTISQSSRVVNGTAAPHLALQASDIGSGDEVLIQSITYVASIQAITATGAKPIFCDVDPDTLTLKIDLKKNLTERTKAIIPVHYAGGVGDLDPIYNFAKENKLRALRKMLLMLLEQFTKNKVGRA